MIHRSLVVATKLAGAVSAQEGHLDLVYGERSLSLSFFTRVDLR